MNLNELIERLKKFPLVTCQIATKEPISKGRIPLKFSQDPPEEPGVYLVYQLQSQRPFYVGEASKLNTRLKFLFRCNSPSNPHPCHRRYEDVFGSMPDVHVFCQTFGVRWLSTAGLIGRLEIEEELQRQLGTNRKRFYMSYDAEQGSAGNNFSSDQRLVPNAPSGNVADGGNMGGNGDNLNSDLSSCSGCPIWSELSTNSNYRNVRGIAISTMAGRAQKLLFCFDPSRNEVHVWRHNGKPDFWFGEEICKKLCRRYQQGLKSGIFPQAPSKGGTSFFNNPNWESPPLGQMNTPYAAAVIHHVWPLAPGNCLR